MKTLILLLMALVAVSVQAVPVGTAFTYQGKLTDSSGAPLSGSYDLSFKLFDDVSAGSQIGSDVTLRGVTVSGGLFSVQLDFGTGAFDGQRRWLETAVGTQTLSPRVEITPAPNAIYSQTVADASVTSGKLAIDATSLVKVSGGAMTSSSGKVGIGTDTPGFPLTFSDALGDKISFFGQNPGPHYGFGLQSNLLQIHTGSVGEDIAFGYGSSASFTETMRVKGNGKVTIGTSSFDYTPRLAITSGDSWDLTNTEGDFNIGDATYQLRFGIARGGGGAGAAGIRAFGGMNMLVLGAGTTESIFVRSNGVGVGTNSPAFPLDVNGTIRSRTGGFEFPDGSVQTTAAGDLADGSVTTTKLADGAVTNAKVADVDWSKLTGVPAGLADGDNDTIYSQGTGLSLDGNTFSLNSAYTDGLYWKLGGNSGTIPGVNYMGTSDDQPLEFKVNGARALRLEPVAEGTPNIVGGYFGNSVAPGVSGATIAGGGDVDFWNNLVTDHFSTIGGGRGNQAGDDDGVAFSHTWATVAGGQANRARGRGSAIGGGGDNTADGAYAVVPGGDQNSALGNYSFAAGSGARAIHHGTFVWSSIYQPGLFNSTSNYQFLINALGGVGIGINDPQVPLDVNGVIRSRSGGFKFPDGTVQTTAGGAPADGSVTTAKLADGAVTSAKLADDSASLSKVSGGVMTSSSGNVGIGTTSPQQALSVNGGMNVDQANANSGGVLPGITFGSDSGEGIASKRNGGGNGGGIDLFTNWTSRLSITNSGNVGIGANTPGFPLTFSDNLGDKISLFGQNPGPNYGFGIQSYLLQIHTGGYDEDVAFGYGSSASFTETMRVKGNGNVGIGTNDPQYKLEVNGSVAGVGSYNQISDLRYKTDISAIRDALGKVGKLRGVTFDWKRAEHPEIDFEDGRQIGLIAQEVEKICPEAVSRDKNGNYSVAYSSLVPVLIEAVKEQQKQIDELKALVSSLAKASK